MKQTWPLFLAVVALFFIEICAELTTTGMFLDGLVYANLAANMAQGIGSFWQPCINPSYEPLFVGHPPLSFGLLALCYKAFGTHLWVTKAYSLGMILLTGLLLVRLWTRVGFRRQTAWLPLLLWVLVPLVSQFACDNMLEGPMGLFVLAAVLCMTHTPASWLRQAGWHLLAGVFLFLAFLTKGFTGLYPLCLPLIIWLADLLFAPQPRRRTLPQALGLTFVTLASTLLCLLLVGLLQPAAVDYLKAYLPLQIVGGIQEHTVGSRWFIVGKFFMAVAIVLGLTLLALLVAAVRGRRSGQRLVAKDRWRTSFIYLLLTLSGVLPMMISTKQSNFYILTVFPFFAVAMGALTSDPVEQWLSRRGRPFRTVSTIVALLLTIGAVTLNVANWGKPGRDVDLQHDVALICAQLQQGERIAITQPLQGEWGLFNYAYRAKQIEMHATNFADPADPRPRHLLANANDPLPDTLYHPIELPTKQLRLFER